MIFFLDNTSAQIETIFTPETQFNIRDQNSTINFSAEGTYKDAIFENNTWIFSNLHLAKSSILDVLRISAENCNVTINSYEKFASTEEAGIIHYAVVGQGTQSFNVGLSQKGRVWSVVINETFLGENDGWYALADETIIVTYHASNITIYYIDNPADLVTNGKGLYSIFQQHSIIILSTLIFLTVLVITVIIKIKNNPKSRAVI